MAIIKKFPGLFKELDEYQSLRSLYDASANNQIKMIDMISKLSSYRFTPGDYNTALSRAAGHGHTETIKKLISLGAGKADKAYVLAMILAAEGNHEDIFEWMVYLGNNN